jgi:glutamate/tyrosine decarboxylase-like PLP-dependent enzyme
MEELDAALDVAVGASRAFLETVADRPVRMPGADEAAEAFAGPLPEEGDGATAALAELGKGLDAAIASGGPRFFHFVIGGSTPAGLGADWLASALDQNNAAWVASPLGTRLEQVSIAWLLDLFGLPSAWSGVLTTGATMANFTALACARGWWAERHGVQIDADGFAGLPAVPVLSGGYVHPSDRKALAMLGIGYESVRVFARDARGRVDLAAMDAALRDLEGAPAIVIASAGEVNAGDFDPIDEMADLAKRYGCWLHVDGAFGLFAAASPRTARLVRGVERADSVIADGHKWLNVPYDCGFAFVREPQRLARSFSMSAAYLERPDAPRPSFAYLGPESSRRARSLPVWATLRAYGRRGVREMVERHLDLTQRVAQRVDAAPDLERLADAPLNIVCFRYRPARADESKLDELNRRLGEQVLRDGRVYVGTTLFEGRVAFRPAIVNWMTREEDVDLLVDVIRELGARITL